ncbi:MAG: hypothetical protein K2H91_05200 [Lachnospiraceae bacterium]|nr:hypothetical protein [Lachnospiraceae bacterium]
MNNRRLLILVTIVILGLGSLGAVRYLATRNGIEESGSGYEQNLAEQSENMQYPTEQSEAEEESTQVPLYIQLQGLEIPPADVTESLSTYFDLDINDMGELDKNTIERAQEFDYQYNEELSVDSGLFSHSVNDIACADIDCHKALLSVLSQYADDQGEDYSVFEMESYYKSMWVEDGLWGHKVLDTGANRTLYIAYTSTGIEIVGYLYKVE